MEALSPVSFFLPGDGDFDRLGALDPDVAPVEFQTAERAWTLQTFLRLRAAGLPVTLTETLPRSGMVVFHAKHKHEVQRERRSSREAVLVALRGDRKPVLTADFEILQNAQLADGRRSFDVPHWPQPGLVPRDPARSGLAVVAYKGFLGNLDPAFRDPRWLRRVAELGLEWRCDAASFDRAGFRHYPVDWSSYREIDAVIAIRPPERDLHAGKPASKLVNAWLAGVPAILGAECACRALRRGPLDYFEATGPDEAVHALERLRDEPGLLAAMIANGRRRAAEFAAEAVVEHWRRLLFEIIPRAAESRCPGRRRSLVTLTVQSWLRRAGTRIAG